MQKFIGEVLSESDTQAASGFSKAINRFLTVVKQVLGLNNKGLDEFVKVSSQLMGHYEPTTTNSGKLYSQSAMKSIEANIKRGTDAMNKAILTKADVKRAMYRNDIGWIDFVWGDVGTIKANGKTKGAMGISHIIEARMRKDGMSYGEAVDMLTNATVVTIAKGNEFDRFEQGGATKLKIQHNGNLVTLVKTRGSNAWMINSFEVFEDGTGKGYGKTSPTHNQSYSARTDVGASNKTNVTQNIPNDNSSHLYAQMTEDNVEDIVNQLSLQDVLKNSIFNGSDEFNTHLDKTIDDFIGGYLYNDTNKRKVNQAITPKPKAFMIGLQMSDKEQAVYEATKAILDEFVKDKNKTSTQAVYEL